MTYTAIEINKIIIYKKKAIIVAMSKYCCEDWWGNSLKGTDKASTEISSKEQAFSNC